MEGYVLFGQQLPTITNNYLKIKIFGGISGGEVSY